MDCTETNKLTITLDGAANSAEPRVVSDACAEVFLSPAYSPQFERLPAYYPGDKVRGHVHLKVGSEDHFTCLNLECMNLLGFNWFRWEKELFEGAAMPAGDHSFPFEFVCPDGPLYHPGWNVGYRITATLVASHQDASRKFSAILTFRLGAPDGAKPKPTTTTSWLGDNDNKDSWDDLARTAGVKIGVPIVLLLGLLALYGQPVALWEWALLLAPVVGCSIWLYSQLRLTVPRALALSVQRAIKTLEVCVKLTPAQGLAVVVDMEANCSIDAVSAALKFEDLLGTIAEQRDPRNPEGRVTQQLGERRVGATKYHGEFELDRVDPAADGWSHSSDFININWVVLVTVRLRRRTYVHRAIVPLVPDVIDGSKTADGRAKAR